MGIRAETAPIVDVARLRIYLVSQPSIDAILHLLESGRGSHVIDARHVREHLLAHSLCAQERGDEIKLGDVRPDCLARIRATKEQTWRDAPLAIPRACVRRHP